MTNNLLTWRNSGYKHQDSTVNQLVNICHKIYTALEDGRDVVFVSLDASSAFDRVWHDGLLFKLRQMGVRGNLYDWIKSYLENRKQRVVINGKFSEWRDLGAGVPQGSILGPLLFLIYTSDIIIDIESDIQMFADDTSLLEIICDKFESYSRVSRDLAKLVSWSKRWLMNFNPSKTKSIIFSKKLIMFIFHP